MLKIRLQGTTNDIKWFKKLLDRDKRINVLQVSDSFANKGTNKYYRVYVVQSRVCCNYWYFISNGQGSIQTVRVPIKHN